MAHKYAAMILAAGYSSRMGRTKALLPFGGCTLIEKQVRMFRNAGIDDVYVVLGHDGARIRQALAPCGVKTVWNARYDEGMFSSICAGLEAIRGKGYDSFLFLPVDYALVRPHLVMQLIRGYEKSGRTLAYVRYQDKKGHPPVFSAAYIDPILAHGGQNGIKGVIRQFDAAAHYEQMPNDECLIDLDTWEDYERALAYWEAKRVPDREESGQILSLAQLPEPVAAHCRTVARVAERLAEAARKAGADCDPALCRAAGLLHDIKRTVPEHAGRGADWLEALGYPRVARCIRFHMELPEGYASRICEQSLVYLADKLCEGAKPVPLETRMARCAADEKKAPFAGARLCAAQAVQRQLEQLTGRRLTNLLAGEDLAWT